MRNVLFPVVDAMPSKLFGASGLAATIYCSIFPQKVARWIETMTAEQVQQFALVGAVVFFAYWFVWALLRTPPVPAGAGPAFTGGTHYHQYETLPEKLKQQQAPAPTRDRPPTTFDEHIVESVEASDTLEATAVTGLHGLYVGNVIVAAGALENERRLELAIVGFNGTGESIRLLDISGRIRAGTGDMRDHVKLPEPVMQGVFKAKPGAEFVMAFRQELSEAQALEYLRALEEKKSVSLDLRGWEILVASDRNPDKSGRLPLWDGVNLRRRDDVVSNRNTIASGANLIAGPSAVFGVATVTRKEEGER